MASLDLPLIGTVKVSSALAFDIGVYLTVVGMVLMAFEAFGDDPTEAVDVTVMLAATAAALFAIGTYLLLQRKLSRIIIGLGLLTHGANVLLITAGRRGEPADHRQRGGRAAFADPLPAGAGAHRHRHHVRRHDAAARARLPQLAAHRATTRCRTTSAIAPSVAADVVHDEVADQEKVIAREEAP